MSHWLVWGEYVCHCECWKYTAQSAKHRLYVSNMKSEWRPAELWRLLAYSSIIWPTCAHMCMTRPGSGSRAQGRPAPATLSSTLLIWRSRRQDADTQPERVCVCVCKHESRPWAGTRFTQGKETLQYVALTSPDTGNTKRSQVTNTTLEVVYIQGQSERTR